MLTVTMLKSFARQDLPKEHRVIEHGAMVTQDFKPDRWAFFCFFGGVFWFLVLVLVLVLVLGLGLGFGKGCEMGWGGMEEEIKLMDKQVECAFGGRRDCETC